MPPLEADVVLNASTSTFSTKRNEPVSPSDTLQTPSNESMPEVLPVSSDEMMVHSLSDLFEDEETTLDFFKSEEAESSPTVNAQNRSVTSFQGTGEDLFNLSTTSDLQNSFKDLITSKNQCKYGTTVGQALKNCATLREEIERLQKPRKQKKQSRSYRYERSKMRKHVIDEAIKEAVDIVEQEYKYKSPKAPARRSVEPKISDITISPFASPQSPPNKLESSNLKFLAASCPSLDNLESLDCSPRKPVRKLEGGATPGLQNLPPMRSLSANSFDCESVTDDDNDSAAINQLPSAVSPKAPVKYYKSPKTPTRETKQAIPVSKKSRRRRSSHGSQGSAQSARSNSCSDRSLSSSGKRKSSKTLVTKIPVKCPGLELAGKSFPKSSSPQIGIKLRKAVEGPRTPKQSKSFSPRQPRRQASNDGSVQGQESPSRWHPTTPKLTQPTTENVKTSRRQVSPLPGVLRTPKLSQSCRNMSRKSPSFSPSASTTSPVGSPQASISRSTPPSVKSKATRRGSQSCRDFDSGSISQAIPSEKKTSSSQRNFDTIEALPVVIPPRRDYFSGEPQTLSKPRTKSNRVSPKAHPSFRTTENSSKDFAPKSPRRRTEASSEDFHRSLPSGLNHCIVESPTHGRNIPIKAPPVLDSSSPKQDWRFMTHSPWNKKLAVESNLKTDHAPKAPQRRHQGNQTFHLSLPTGLDYQTAMET